MDPKIVAEISKTPSIPFRATQGHVHHTWARTYYSRPELYLQPQTLTEIQKIVNAARALRKRIVVVGSGHSPSDLTCTRSWMVNLDRYAAVLSVDRPQKRLTVQAGIRLRDLNARAAEHGLTMPIIGSVDDQSLAGAIATGTHGSSIVHGLMSAYVRGLKIVLGDGSIVQCSATEREDLFRAALVSLGALGVVVEIEYQMIEDRNIEWVQSIMALDDVLDAWNKDLWTQAEHTRVWWMPYTRRAIVWRANATDKPLRKLKSGFYDSQLGYYVYYSLLWVSHYIPRFLPTVEWFVFGMQYGFDNSMVLSGIEPQREGLLMNCLYSQFVNEWAIPSSSGPDAIRQLDAWFNRRPDSKIPLPSKRLYVHAPIEVRVVNSKESESSLRGYLDPSCPTEPTLYLNATLYRPAGLDPPCRPIYYEVFEKFMTSMGGRPHWAKNFTGGVNHTSLPSMYGENLEAWEKARAETDPERVFWGSWHQRTLEA
jgi:D-arabinono-1,4-lactone oxidase